MAKPEWVDSKAALLRELPKTHFILKDPQEEVARRVTQQCRNQFGHLILHSPGSGKTQIALHILMNYGPVLETSDEPQNPSARPVIKEVNTEGPDGIETKYKRALQDGDEALQKELLPKLIAEEDKRTRVVLLPAGVQDTFANREGGDVAMFQTRDKKGPSNLKSTYTIMTFKKAAEVTRDFETCLQNETGTGCSIVKTTLTDMFRNKIVIVDEAHNLLKYLRSKDQKAIVRAFKSAKRVVLMTGTPILRPRSDLTLLFNLLENNVSTYTDNDGVFDESYYQKTEKTTLKRIAQWATEIPVAYGTKALKDLPASVLGLAPTDLRAVYTPLAVGIISLFTNYFNIPLDTFQVPSVQFISSAIGVTTLAITFTLGKFIEDSYGRIIGEALKSKYNPIAYVQSHLRELDTRELNADFDKLVKTKTSYFDYEDSPSERLKYPFPIREPVAIQYSERQVRILISLLQKETREIPLAEIYNEIPIDVGEDPVENVGDFVKFGLLLGNYSEIRPELDPLPYVKNPFPFQMKTALEYVDRDLNAYGFLQRSKDPTHSLEEYVLRGFFPKDIRVQGPVYECAKFKAMYACLQGIRRNDNKQFSALVTYGKRLIRTQDDKINALSYFAELESASSRELESLKTQSRDSKWITAYTIQRNKLSFARESIRAISTEPLSDTKALVDPNRTYLPLVWSNFKSSFEAFGAYLTSLGETYIVVHRDDTGIQRKMEESCWMTSYPVCDSAIVSETIGSQTVEYKRPICVLLHPDVIEALSFTFSPALLAMETIRGYGVQKQVYARILRGFDESKQAQDVLSRERVKKYIYEFHGNYYNTHSIETRDGDPYKLKVIPAVYSFHLASTLQTSLTHLKYVAKNFLAVLGNDALYQRAGRDAASPEDIQKLWNSKTEKLQQKIGLLYNKPYTDFSIGTTCEGSCGSSCTFCNQGFLGPGKDETKCGSFSRSADQSLCRNQVLQDANCSATVA